MIRATLPLDGLRIVLVEDHYLVAAELAQALCALGATVLGPVGTMKLAADLVEHQHDMALLNVDLHGEAVFPLVDTLVKRGIPVAFVTGYDGAMLPKPYHRFPRLRKPMEIGPLTHSVLQLTGRHVPAPAAA